ncbi:MAG: bifunctional lysylphosphatidylglycerol flippase/synthetase MprF [Alphaproteobacteria bacterium]|nr:bifunctional lysylphosphatidylglycerol flippase/synthetase MprF [Alphaproteobacteria bacterium]
MTNPSAAGSTNPTGRHLPARLRSFAPILLGIALFALGVFALYHLLRPVNPADVLKQARATPPALLAAALGATFLGYVALIGYDWSALRYLGKKLPLRIIAIGGFLGYSFGNTIGISIVSGGAVRYRIYSAFGLNAFEVARVSTFVALAFGFGITVIGLGALAFHPYALESVLPWSPALTRLLAAVSAVGLLGVLTWSAVSGKTFRLKNLEIAAPSPGILLGQLAFTLIDIIMAALTLYVLLPAGVPDFITFVAIFAAAAMAGVLSHVPGGVGVFESVIIASMPAGVPLDQVAAGLLMYRLVYYLVPFTLALVFVALNEARLAGGLAARLLGDVSEQMRPIARIATSVAPSVTGTMAFGLGVYLLLMALIPSAIPNQIDPNDLLAAVLLEGGALFSAALGVVLILLSQGLIRRISGAFWLTEIALVAGVLASMLNGLDTESALLLIAAATVLWPLRAEFYRSAKLTQGVLSPGWFALVAGIVLGVAAFFFSVHANTPYSNDLWTEFAGGANTPRALRAALLASALLTFVTIYLALQPARAHSRPPDENALATAKRIIAAQNDPEACLALSGDKSLFFNDTEDAFIMYARQGRSWVAYRDPVGPQDAVRDLAWSFFDEAYAANCRPIFYEVSEKYLPLWIEMGFTLHKMGEESIIHLPEFSLAGGKFKKMRAAHHKALRSGLQFSICTPPHSTDFIDQLRTISDAWMGGRKGREKGFSVGRFDAEYLGNFPIAIVRREGRVLAFANILRPGDGAHVSIDLMRYLPEEASGMMEFLFIEVMQLYRDQGAVDFSLGMAPLAGLETRHGTRLWNRFGALLFRHGGGFYNFAGLRGFKQKFRPAWQSSFIAVPGGTTPLVALKDVAILIAGGAMAVVRK